jgi:hypothetical protein
MLAPMLHVVAALDNKWNPCEYREKTTNKARHGTRKEGRNGSVPSRKLDLGGGMITMRDDLPGDLSGSIRGLRNKDNRPVRRTSQGS